MESTDLLLFNIKATLSNLKDNYIDTDEIPRNLKAAANFIECHLYPDKAVTGLKIELLEAALRLDLCAQLISNEADRDKFHTWAAHFRNFAITGEKRK